MEERERSVLHVLPHTGGGGDTYVDVLSEMRGYGFRRVYVTPKRKPGVGQVVAGLLDLSRVLRGYDLVHIHGEATASLFLPLLAARPSVATLHGLHLLRRVSGLRRQGAALNARAILRAASRTICVSNAEREELASVVGRSAISRAVVVHNGAHIARPATDAARAAVRRELGIRDTGPIGIWVGSLDERRDPLVVVRAAMRTSTALLIVGDGPLRPEVERAARPPVHLLGQRNDVPRLLAAADFFVLMSEREGFSFALLEAMAHGLPTIVADVPENIEAIGESGLAVPYGNESALMAALRVLTDDHARRADLGRLARSRVVERFAADEMVAQTRAVYEGVLARRGRAPRSV
jgi:glycosyltransferase involved in cell wall biosynthesis